MPTYVCHGSLELNGVIFTITADNIEAARMKAKNNEYDEYETDRAEAINVELRVGSLERN